MTLRLSVENMDRLPDGGPLRVEVKCRGLDIGRDSHLDWCLPDPSRYVSGKHCEIRFRDGDYWLHDVSTNGTFVNGAAFRLDAPYLLRSGDRLNIGPYIVAVMVEGQATAGAAPAVARDRAAAGFDAWGAAGEAAAPEDRSGFRVQTPPAPAPDFLDFASSFGPGAESRDAFVAPAPEQDEWLRAVPAAPVAPSAPSPITPSPRRPAPPASAKAPSTGPSVPPAAADALIARIAAAAGIPEQAIAGRAPEALADEIGFALRLTVQNLAQLLASRAESKTAMRSASRTMIRALENNPLKFTGTPEEALAIMFGRPTRTYLDARAAIESGFADLKAHQVLTFGAMQSALEALFEDLAPDGIDRSTEPDRGIGAFVLSRKAKLWDVYVERWRAKAKRADGRLTEAFMNHFAEAYDRLNVHS
ncbi:MAG: type VI secretion system-associated FHA domain protein TagH [Hyphomicrobiales bacterium]|nr:type VI secretion system-associated FHA domain protein TagH [Hyphomicrobiales bacterium]MBV8664510.1 type VI secretion system-associated FHA domain protein TagH [Hyphomicrobiales bacterium]